MLLNLAIKKHIIRLAIIINIYTPADADKSEGAGLGVNGGWVLGVSRGRAREEGRGEGGKDCVVGRCCSVLL